jgi:virginiamycin B lyase
MGTQDSVSGNPEKLVEGANGGIYAALATSGGLGELAEDSFGGDTFGTWNDFGVTTVGTGSVVSDPNGVLWYAEPGNNSLIRMTTYGSLLSRVTLASGAAPYGLTVGPDQASIYVTEYATNAIAKYDLNGNLLSTTAVTSGSGPNQITSGSDGNVYFTEYTSATCTGTGYIGKLTPAGVLTMIATPDCGGFGITSGSDGNIWFLNGEVDSVEQYNVTTGALTPYTITSGCTGARRHPYDIVSGADGQLWFTCQNGPYVTAFQP